MEHGLLFYRDKAFIGFGKHWYPVKKEMPYGWLRIASNGLRPWAKSRLHTSITKYQPFSNENLIILKKS